METLVRFAPRRLGHLNIFVTDVEKSAAFYRDVCGFREVFREPGISMIFMSNGNTHHDLGLMEITQKERIGRDGHVQVHPGMGKTPGLNHLGMEMENEAQLVDAYKRAKAQDVSISRTTDHQISHSVYLSEINGHTLEFYADMIEDWHEFYAQNTGELISGHWEPGATAPTRDSRFSPEPSLYRETSAVLQARNVAYAGLPVKNLEHSLKYYAEVLGLDPVAVDRDAKFAILQGSAKGGCDICLVEVPDFPAVRLLFGGVTLHDGKSIADAERTLKDKGIPVTVVGGGAASCIVVVDPDGIPLVYSTSPAKDLFSMHGADLIGEIRRLLAARIKAG